ncbi:MAG: hypothetical protein JWR38_5284 [Mucilaginibacter sp.]|nr:hypothetical protein [Mucilaginibacter sp.]
MDRQLSFERLALLYMPWVLAWLFKSDPTVSYLIAWSGSFFIFFITLTGWIRPIPADLPLSAQLMRPIFLVHIMFAGYTCCTSIFYFLDVLGYVNFSKISNSFLIDMKRLELTAQCQRYYCLGHAALISGMLTFMKHPGHYKNRVVSTNVSGLLFYIAIITLPFSIIVVAIPGLSQFARQFGSLSFIAGTLALAFAIPQKKSWNTMICLGLYFSNFYSASTSGFKEPIIISVLVLGIFLYPVYKKMVLIIFIPILLGLFFLLPTYVRVFRENAWAGNASTHDATQLALNAIINQDDDIQETNWDFLAYRLSEIDMFTKFVHTTPSQIDYYKEDLWKQSLWAIIPRAFWPGKPNAEELVMKRVYAAGVINPNSNVSAKPAFIVDAYLSYGGFGIWLFMFAYGAAAQLISLKAEQLFGGYLLGTALIFSGLFQVFWRGSSLEFIVNTVFWSYISMLLIAWVFKSKNILKPV